MDAAPEHYSVVTTDVDYYVSADWGSWPGQTWQMGVANPIPLTPSLDPYFDAQTAGLAVVSATHEQRAALLKHEMGHLFGIQITGTMYKDPMPGKPQPWIFQYFPSPIGK